MNTLLQRLKMADDMDSRDAADEIERLRAALRDLFLLACVSQDIRVDAPQMKAAGKLIAASEQGEGK